MTMRRLRNSMYKARMDSYPQIPDTLSEATQLLLQRRWSKISSSVDGDDNLYAGSVTAMDGSHNILFMSRRMREFAGRISILQSDGTFRARPIVPPTSQVFVLVTPWRNAVSDENFMKVNIQWLKFQRKLKIHSFTTLAQTLQNSCILLKS